MSITEEGRGSKHVDEDAETKLEEEQVVDRTCALTSSTASGAQRLEEEKRLVRKLDKRIMPILCAMYLFQSLDTASLGNARVQGLSRDVLHGDSTGVLYDWVASASAFPAVLLQLPLVLLLKLSSPRVWLGSVGVGWSLCAVLSSTVFDFPGLIVARIGLGSFEAAFSPGFPLYLSLFYTREEIGMRIACLHALDAVAGAFSGLIAFGVQHAHTIVANWRLLFIIEGAPGILLALCALFVLPDRPEDTHIFNDREREIALERRNRGCQGDIGKVIQRAHVVSAFKDWKVYCAAAVHFGVYCASSSITAFLPTIIKTFYYSDALAQLLTVPPYAVAGLVMCLTSYASDRLQSRGVFVAAASCVTGIGYVMLLTVPSTSVRYFATFCVTMGAYTANALILAWFSHNFGSETKTAAGVPLFDSLGECGSLLGPHLFPSKEGPRYVKGFAATAAVQFLGAVAALILVTHFRMENRRRDARFGKPVPGASVDTSELADEAPDFRYTP
ncbi:MFS general substrate transporter [Fomes fomentarius]|nr:MFS general substrate transporter [Fomes fomentarius]